MIAEIIAVGMIVSAFLAVYLDEAVYSVASLAGTLVLTAILYSVNDVVFAAVFQFVISMGALAVLFLSGETLTEKTDAGKGFRKALLGLAAGLALSIPSLVVSFQMIPATIHVDASFSDALWGFRRIDIVLQGLTMLTVALGITIILGERRRKRSD
jgi:NADH:ubiquinone oxidoreductase subunit 6 (subunit J)